MNNKMTVLVCSCDNYEDLWLPFFTMLKKHWPGFDYRIILNTESKKFSFSNLHIETLSLFPNKKVSYGKRMRAHLKTISTPFTLLLLDDFFIRESVDVACIQKVIEYMENDPNIATFNFDCINEEENIKCNYDDYIQRSAIGHYKLNMQAGIWRTNILLDYWKNSDSPWSWEIYGTSRTFANDYKFYCLTDIAKSPIKYGKEKGVFGVFRGKWIKEDIFPLFSNEGLDIDYSNRGFYNNEENDDVLGKSIIKKIKTAFEALTIHYFLVWLGLKIRKIIQIILHLKTNNEDYIDFVKKHSR